MPAYLVWEGLNGHCRMSVKNIRNIRPERPTELASIFQTSNVFVRIVATYIGVDSHPFCRDELSGLLSRVRGKTYTISRGYPRWWKGRLYGIYLTARSQLERKIARSSLEVGRVLEKDFLRFLGVKLFVFIQTRFIHP